MSTEFYILESSNQELDDIDTIVQYFGLRYGSGNGTVSFICKVPLTLLNFFIGAHYNTHIIVDEYGQKYTGEEFAKVMEKFLKIEVDI